MPDEEKFLIDNQMIMNIQKFFLQKRLRVMEKAVFLQPQNRKFCDIVQPPQLSWSEHLTVNQGVSGSSPEGGAFFMFHVINFLASQILPVSTGFFCGYATAKSRDIRRLLIGCRPFGAGLEQRLENQLNIAKEAPIIEIIEIDFYFVGPDDGVVVSLWVGLLGEQFFFVAVFVFIFLPAAWPPC